MNVKTTLLSTLFVSSLAISGASHAQDSSVQLVLNSMMSNAVTELGQEIDTQIQKSVLSFSNSIEIFADETISNIKTSVSITDLPVLEISAPTHTQSNTLHSAQITYDELNELDSGAN